jgi:anti-anti-sigma factor
MGGAFLDLDVGQDGDSTVVRLAGELDFRTSGDLQLVARTALAAARSVVVDLGGVTFIDSSGMRALLDIREEAVGRAVDVSFARPQQSTSLSMFDVLGVDDLLPWRAA